jgi:phospholipase/carboxylesterase
MTRQYDAPIVLEPEQPARACVIWLHGLGADGSDFVPVVPQLCLPETLAVRFVFPHAPVQPVTINGGYRMRAWFDIVEADLQRELDLDGVAESVAYLQQLIDEQLAAGIGLDRLVLAGFSQGGVVALDCALQMPHKPAGVLALSTYLAQARGEGQGLQIFQAHGTQDPIVPMQAALQARAGLEGLGAEVAWHEYPMPHGVHPTEIMEMARWLRARLA